MTTSNVPTQSLAQAMLTPPFLAQVEKLIARVHYLTTAYDLLGLSPRTFQSWRKEGELLRDRIFNEELTLSDLDPRQRVLFDFAIAVNRGLARAEARDLGVIDAASLKNWRAAAWRLERRAPERWGPNRKSSEPSEATLLELAAQVAKLLAAPPRGSESPVAPAPGVDTKPAASADAERKQPVEQSSTGASTGGSRRPARPNNQRPPIDVMGAVMRREDIPISVGPLLNGKH